MLATLAIAFISALLIAFAVMPKAGRFIIHELKSFFVLGRNTASPVEFLLLFELMLGVCTFVFYKVSISIWAFLLSDDLIQHFVLSRGVFSMDAGAQFALQPSSLMMLLGTVALKFLSCSFIYNRTGAFLVSMQPRYPSLQAYDLGKQILLSFAGVLLFIAMEVMFLAQDIALVSKYSNLILLIISNLSLIAFFVCIVHLRYKHDHPEYFVDLQTYVNIEDPLQRILRSDAFSVTSILLFGYCLHLPQYFGLQFLEDNLVLVLLMVGVVCIFIFVVFRRFFASLFDVLTRVFLLPHFGSEPMTSDRRWHPHRRLAIGLTLILLILVLIKMPSLLSFFVIGLMVVGVAVGSLLLTIRCFLRLAGFLVELWHFKIDHRHYLQRVSGFAHGILEIQGVRFGLACGLAPRLFPVADLGGIARGIPEDIPRSKLWLFSYCVR